MFILIKWHYLSGLIYYLDLKFMFAFVSLQVNIFIVMMSIPIKELKWSYFKT